MVKDFGIGRRIFKIEVFKFRSNIKAESHFSGLFQGLLQGVTGISFMRATIGLQDIAKHPSHFCLFICAPRKQGKGVGIRFCEHIALLDPGKAFYG